jgi:hypothetical protein
MARVIIEAQTADNLKTLIGLALENQLRIMGFGIAKTKRKLETLEREYGIGSKAFYEEFQKGELGDDMKYIRWAGEYETLERLQKDYTDLQGLELCS